MKIRKIISVIAFMLIVTGITCELNRIFVRKSDTEIWEQFYSIQEDAMDVVLIGSSLIGCAVDPYHLGAKTNCNVYNLSVSGQSYGLHPAFLKEVLKTQSPKVIIVEVYRYLGEVETSLDAALNSTSGMKMSLNKLNCITNLPLQETGHRVELFIPLLAHHNRWDELKKEDFNKKTEYSELILWHDGGHGASNEQREITLFDTTEIGGINKDAQKYIDELCEIAKEGDCELVFFNPPNPEYEENSYKNLNAIYQYLDSKGVKYLDCNQDKELVDSMDEYIDFCDYHHTSLSGTYKTTEFFVEYLNEMYQFKDRDFVNTDYYQKYLEYKEEAMKSQSNFSMYVQNLYCEQWNVSYRMQEECTDKQIVQGLYNFDYVTECEELFSMMPDMESCLVQIVVSDKQTGEILSASYVSKENAGVVNHINLEKGSSLIEK